MPVRCYRFGELAVLDEFNIVLVGVGGQGTILAAEILGAAAVKDGLNVRVSEIHGMAQRGGAVTSNVRIGRKVLSSTVLEGQADVLVGFEPLETIRNLKFVSERTLVIMSDERVSPTELAAKKIEYPRFHEIVEKIYLFTKKLTIVQTEKLAKEAGSSLTRNVILLGALTAAERFPIKTESLREALKELVPAKHVEANLKAFTLGYEYVMQKAKTF
jgi:indolepyruvate ferredoxin oxidoreductase beta subunit